MTFTAPLGLLALLALPAVLWLHLFRTRLPERRVAALFLFPAQSLIAGAGRTRTWSIVMFRASSLPLSLGWRVRWMISGWLPASTNRLAAPSPGSSSVAASPLRPWCEPPRSRP